MVGNKITEATYWPLESTSLHQPEQPKRKNPPLHKQAKESKYIMLHAPKDKLDEVKALLPGAENPTLLPLAGNDNSVAVHVVSTETMFWETMEKLKALGCRSILVLPIEKMLG